MREEVARFASHRGCKTWHDHGEYLQQSVMSQQAEAAAQALYGLQGLGSTPPTTRRRFDPTKPMTTTAARLLAVGGAITTGARR